MSFSVCGIKVEITFLFVAFISFLISLKVPANVFFTVISSLFHELGHLFVMLILNTKPQKVRFELTGINIIRQNSVLSPKDEVFTALGGPLFKGLLLVLSCILLCFYENEGLMTFACTNLILMVFNLLPIKKLDGGIVLYNMLIQFLSLEKILIIQKCISIFFILIIYIWGIYAFYASRFNFSLIIIAIFLTLSLVSDKEC